MKRIYELSSYGKELTGYYYNGYRIDIENEKRPYSMFGYKKWYYITLKNGKKYCFDKLCEAKNEIDKDIQGCE